MKKENLIQSIKRSAQVGFLGIALVFGGAQDSCDSSDGRTGSDVKTLSSGSYCTANGSECNSYNPFPVNGTCPPTITLPYGQTLYLRQCY